MPSMADIHPTAIIDPTCEIADDVKIGPYCVVGPHVTLGKGCVLHNHVVIGGPSTFGECNEFFPFAVIGLKTQDLKYKGEPTFLEVGHHNVFRENCNINRSTSAETKTIIGNYNNFLINSHCGHEVVVGDHCILSGFAGVAGHCHIEDWAIISGFAALHQFVRVGKHAMVGGCARVGKDVPPFTIVEGHPATVRSINLVGMQRRGFTEDEIRAVKLCYKKLFLNKGCNQAEGLAAIEADERSGQNPCAKYMVDFVRSSERGCLQ